MQTHSSAILLLLVAALQGGVASGGGKNRDFFEVRSHGPAEAQTKTYQNFYSNHHSSEFGNISSYRHLEHQRRRGSLQHHKSNPKSSILYHSSNPKGSVVHHSGNSQGSMLHHINNPRGSISHHGSNPQDSILRYRGNPEGSLMHRSNHPKSSIPHHRNNPHGSILHRRSTPQDSILHPRGNLQDFPEGDHRAIHYSNVVAEGVEGGATYYYIPELELQGQEPLTWTAKPRPEDELEGTTRDPAIPENPEGLKNPSLLTGPWEDEPLVRITEAHFKGLNGSIVEAQADTTANLPCVVVKRADHETVSWVRRRDHHLITVGRQTYSNDDRFSVTYNRHRNEWTLHIRFVQPRDAGEYMCQLSTHPPMVFISTLAITRASSVIEGGPEMHVHRGSEVVLTCTLKHHTQTPEYVFWYHNGTMINFHTDRQVSVREKEDGSVLTVSSVGRKDSGNYTCVPANAGAASVTLHIISSDAPAAMQVSGSSLATPIDLLALLIFFLIVSCSICYLKDCHPL